MPQATIVVAIPTLLMDGLPLQLTALFNRVALCAAIVTMNCEVARVPDVCVGIQTPIAFNLSMRCIVMHRAAGLVHIRCFGRSNYVMPIFQLQHLARAVTLHDIGCCCQQRSFRWKILETVLQQHSCNRGCRYQ